MREGTRERGFTLVEVMVVVGLIAILALIVVPSYVRESRKTRSSTEVSPMLTELANREQQYKQESGVYLAVAACPATPTSGEQDITSTCMASTSAWVNPLRVQPHAMKLRCSYTIRVGLTTDKPADDAEWPSTFAAAPSTSGYVADNWYFILAKCDSNGNGTYAQYMQASWDSRIQIKDEGE